MASTPIYWLPAQSGLFLHIPPGNDYRTGYLPCSLASVKVKASIIDMVSRVTLSQTFRNDTADTAHEALYRFPLYENSAVCAFTMEHSGRKIKGIVKAEEEAIKTYEAAKAEGKTAALVLQKEPDIFQTKVGNIPPKTSITVTLTYITPLKQDTESNSIRFTLPTSIAPRYGDGSSTGSSNVKSGDVGFDLTVDAKMPSQITSVSSPSHPISMSFSSPTSAEICLSHASPSLDKDVVILVAAKGIDEPRCVIETHPTTATKCAMLTLVPKFNLPRVPTEVIFVIDRSGSMYDKVDTLKRALQIFLKSLPASPEIYFNICSFGSSFDFLFKDGKSKKYDAKTLKTAEDFVQKVDANYGGTEILAPLLECMKKRRTECQTTIMLLTDGEVYNTTAIIDAIVREKAKHKDKPLRVFSLGIGDSVSHHLVEGIARAGDGYSQLVMAQERLDKKVVRMLSSGLQTPLNDLHIDWPGKPPADEMLYKFAKENPEEEFDMVEKEGKTSNTFFDKEAEDDTDAMKTDPPPEPPKAFLKRPMIQQFPETIPHLYNASRHVMFLLFPSTHPTPQHVTLKGTVPGGLVMSLDVPLTEYAIKSEETPIVHTLAARTLLSELEEGRLTAQKAHQDEDSLQDAVKAEGIRIGVKYGLASKWTSFVAVDEESKMKIDEKNPASGDDEEDDDLQVYGLEYGLESFSVSASGATPKPAARMRRGMACSFSPPSGAAVAVQERGESLDSFTSTSVNLSMDSSSFRSHSKGMPRAGGGPVQLAKRAFGGIGSLLPGASRDKDSKKSAPAPPPPPASQPAPASKLRKAKMSPSFSYESCISRDESIPQLEERGLAQGAADEDKLHAIIMQQSSSGAFPSNATLASYIGFTSVTAVKEKTPHNLQNITSDVWMTALVCMFLEKKLAGEKDAWELVVEKAWAFVESNVGAEKVAELKAAADSVIGG